MNIYKKIEEKKLVPVVVIEDISNAVPLAEALLSENLPVIEITFRTPAAAESISLIKREYPEMIIGAGTVLKVAQVKAAINSNSMFIVTPGFNPTIVDYCVENDIPIVPGLNAPTFIEWGLERNLNHFKFYPANVSGGPQMLKSFSAPYPSAKFMPSGGIDSKSLLPYLKLDNVFACGGSWLVQKDLISAKKFDEIRKRVRKALSLIKSNLP